MSAGGVVMDRKAVDALLQLAGEFPSQPIVGHGLYARYTDAIDILSGPLPALAVAYQEAMEVLADLLWEPLGKTVAEKIERVHRKGRARALLARYDSGANGDPGGDQ